MKPMRIRLTFEERAALQWLAGWHARRAGDPSWHLRMFSRLGIETLASLVPPALVSAPRPSPKRGAPSGPHRPLTTAVPVPERLRAPLTALALAFNLERPQDVVAAIASEILRRAPEIAVGSCGAGGFTAIGALVSELQELLLTEVQSRKGATCVI